MSRHYILQAINAQGQKHDASVSWSDPGSARKHFRSAGSQMLRNSIVRAKTSRRLRGAVHVVAEESRNVVGKFNLEPSGFQTSDAYSEYADRRVYSRIYHTLAPYPEWMHDMCNVQYRYRIYKLFHVYFCTVLHMYTNQCTYVCMHCSWEDRYVTIYRKAQRAGIGIFAKNLLFDWKVISITSQ